MESRSIKVRRNWGVISPVTKVVPSEKIYDRNKQDDERKTLTDWLEEDPKP